MSQVIIRIALLIVAFGYGSSTIAGPQKKLVPKGWKKVSVCNISFNVPGALKTRNVTGIDSCVAAFGSDNMELTIDYGLYGAAYKKNDGLEFKEESIEIDGKKAQVVTYTDDNRDAQDKPRLKYVAGIYAVVKEPGGKDAPRMKMSLNMTIRGRSKKEQELARRIFRSINFQ